MSLTSPAQGIRTWPSLTSYWQKGTSPNEIWYALGAQNQSAFATISFAAGTIRGMRFEVSRTVVLDRIAFEVTTGGAAGSVARCGIYRVTSPTNQYPSSLVIDGGEKDTTSIAVHSTNVSVSLSPGSYWAVLLSGVNAPTVRRYGANSLAMAVADSTLATPPTIISVAFSYAALPATFPGSASLSATTVNPVIAARFSS